MPADADLAAAFSIQASAKLAAGVRRAIRDGPHKNMQAGKKKDFISHRALRGHREKKVYQVNRVSGCGYQSIRLPDIRGTGEQGA